MRKNTLRVLTVTAVLAASATVITGCGAADDLINRRVTHTYDDAAALRADSDVAPSWVPDDATGITVRTPSDTSGGVAVVLLDSASPLAGDCVTQERRSAAMLSIEGSPDVYKATEVAVCGDWSVVPSEGGWFGWTPNTEDQNTEGQ